MPSMTSPATDAVKLFASLDPLGESFRWGLQVAEWYELEDAVTTSPSVVMGRD